MRSSSCLFHSDGVCSNDRHSHCFFWFFLLCINDFSVSNMRNAMLGFDQPITHPNFFGALALAERAKQNKVKMVFSGEGADELFSGYRWHLNPKIDNLEILGYLDREQTARYFGIDLKDYNYINDLNRDIFFKSFYLRKWLLRADLTGMFHSIEVRVPFLSKKLSDLSKTLSFLDKTDGGKIEKAVLKRLLLDELGSKFVHRKKVGFDYPLNDWINDDYRSEMSKIDFLDTKDVDHLFKNRFSDYRKSRSIFVLTCFSLWNQDGYTAFQ